MKPYTGDLARPGTLQQALEVSTGQPGPYNAVAPASCASSSAARANICDIHDWTCVLKGHCRHQAALPTAVACPLLGDSMAHDWHNHLSPDSQHMPVAYTDEGPAATEEVNLTLHGFTACLSQVVAVD